MNDLISRRAAIDALHKWELSYTWDEYCRESPSEVYSPSSAIKELPAAEQKRESGEWLMISDFPDRLICSECGAQFDVWHWESEQMHFCPNCGADMRGE